MADSAIENEWQRWTLDQWNNALFNHYFRNLAKNLDVRRIPVTEGDLKELVGCPGAEPQEIREGFLRTIRTENVEEMLRASYWRRAWNEDGTPPFFAYLFLTCLAASGDEETAAIGNFRFRLNEMLSNDVRYMLPQLSRLWEYLADWLAAEHQRDPTIAFLILPDPGNEVRIGYSKRLAFPAQRDKNRMIALFHDRGISNEIRVPQILRLLNRNSERFSRSFKSDLEEFDARFSSGLVNLDKSHFWSAVLHAVAESQQVSLIDVAAASLVMLPDSQGNNRLFVLLDSPELGVSLSETRTNPATHDRSKHVLEIGPGPTMSAVDRAAELLLAGELDEHVPLVQASTLRASISQGVLLFDVDEHGIHEFRGSLPPSGSIQLLLHSELATTFESLCAESKIQFSSRDSRYDGWTEILNVTAEDLRKIDLSRHEELATIHCFQVPRKIYRIAVRGGLKSGRAFLGYQEVLPEVRAVAADSVTVSSLSDDEPKRSIKLEVVTGGEDFVFAFPSPKISKPLRGRFRVTARDREGVLASCDLTFRLKTIGWDFKTPESGTHRVESGVCSTVLFSDVNQLTAAHRAAPLAAENEISLHPFQPNMENHDSETLRAVSHSKADRAVVRRTEEICAALAINQNGIKPVTILSLFDSQFPELNRWDVLRAWVEAGSFDRLTSTRGATTYVARRPRINHSVRNGEHVGTVTGLTTRVFRARLRQMASKLGCEVTEGLSFTSCLVGPLLIHSPSKHAIEDLAKRLDAPIQCEPMEWDRFLNHVAMIANQNQREDAPLNYNHSRDSWRSHDGGECTVKRHKRLVQRDGREYQESQDYYAVVHKSHESWTYSKNWAMLTAMSLTDHLPFYTTGNHCVARSSQEHVYLPLPVGRLCVLVASSVGGPLPQTQPNATYVYPVLSELRLKELIARLFGSSTDFENRVLDIVNYHGRSVGKKCFRLPRLVQRSFLEICDSTSTRSLVKGEVSSTTCMMACRLVKEIRGARR